jgi:hypothetical protein
MDGFIELPEEESVLYVTELCIRYWVDGMVTRRIRLEFDTMEAVALRVYELRTAKRSPIHYGIDVEALIASNDYWKKILGHYNDLEIRLTDDFLKVYKQVTTLVPERSLKIANLDL